jgi:glycosyltransferase involved in cell wall biosynthesis
MKKPKLLRITTVPISLYKLLEGQPQFMQQNGFEVILASADGKEIKQIEQTTGLKVHTLPLTRKISPLTDLLALWKTYKLIKKTQPDIVHTHTPKAGIIGILAAKLAGVPVRMHTVAGMPLLVTKGLKRILLKQVEKITFWAATNVYPNSFGLKEIIINQQLAPPKKLKVIANGSSNGINTTYFDPKRFSYEHKENLKKQLGISSGDFVFIFIGRLVGDKGINELIQATDKLSKSFSKFKLLLVGNEEPDLDPLLPETKELIHNHTQIISTGWVNDVRPYLAVADILVFPSYREGFPNVVLQAGAMNLPAIVTDINGCNEIITHMKNGLIIPVKNTEELYKTMKLVIEDKGLIIRLKENTRELIQKKYNRTVVLKALLTRAIYSFKSAVLFDLEA